ncbi:ABC transporter transmembrane region domain-containing protein [Ditylenchus destructor]|nr:ABC transporter transmembrane region domain-containing protein [Ditylenchus destructor]
MTKDGLTSPLPTSEGQSDPLISPEEKCNINSDRQKERLPFLEENQGSSRKMGARKGGKSSKMCCFNSKKESQDGAKKEYQAATFREMLRYAEPRDWWMLSGALTGSILTGLTYSLHCYNYGGLSNALLEGEFQYNNGTLWENMDTFSGKIMFHVWRYFFLGCAEFIIVMMSMGCMYTLCERQTYRIKKKLFESILNQDMTWFDHNEVGALTQKMTAGIDKIKAGMCDKFIIMLQAISNMIIGVLVGLYMSWQMTLIMLAMTPFIVFSMVYSAHWLSKSVRREMDAYANAGGVAEEVISGIRTVASFNAQEFEANRYETLLKAGRKMGYQKALATGICNALFLSVMHFSLSIGMFGGTVLTLNGVMTPGMVFGVFWAVMDGAVRFGEAIPQVNIIISAKMAAGEIFSIIDQKPFIDSSNSSGMKLKEVKGQLKFEDVHFNYPTRPGVKVLEGISLDVNPGETVALVGHSGCGKSTIVSLLMRFYDFYKGSVTLDGVPIQDLNVEWLRNTIGLVSQEPVLFAATVEENLRMGKPDATLDEMVKACKTANAHEFIAKLPQGYKCLIGEGGVKFSGGQKQRLAIARALIRKPKILLLDEATSALDTESESIVQKAIERASIGRTTITIAHRLSTVRSANKIIVISKGKIVESGTHDKLMSLEGSAYRQLVEAQEIVAESKDSDEEEEGQIERHQVPPFSRFNSKDSAENSFAALSRRDWMRGSMISIKSGAEYEESAKQLIEEDTSPASIMEIIRFSKREFKLLILGLVLTVFRGLGWPAFSVIYGQSFKVLSNTFDERNYEEVMSKTILNCILFAIIAVLGFVAAIGAASCFGIAGERISLRLRMAVFKNILRQDASFFDDSAHSTGKLTGRLATDAPAVQAAIDERLAVVLQSWVALVAGISIAFYFGWKMAPFGIAIAIVLLIVQIAATSVLKRYGMRHAKISERSAQISSEAISNVRTVQALTRQQFIFDAFCKSSDAPYRLAKVQGLWQSFSYAISMTYFNFNFAATYAIGLWLIQSGHATPFSIFQVLEALVMGSFAIMMTTAYFPEFLKAKIAAGLMFAILAKEPKIDGMSDAGDTQPISGSVELSNVHFAYPNSSKRLVLNECTLEAKVGQTVALVGASGCGKSTIVQLIERFYDVLSGNLSIDGTDVRQYNIKHVRQAVSVVGQEPILFNFSIAQNIAYGMPPETVNESRIEEVARLANIHDFVMSLPEKYETSCGSKGTQLSGGQKQRIAIARAMFRNPKILLLDEATSALDTESEKVVQEALDRAGQGRTCLVVAHRLSTIQHADLICVIRNGRVIERGTHQELMAMKGAYYRLVEKQSNRQKADPKKCYWNSNRNLASEYSSPGCFSFRQQRTLNLYALTPFGRNDRKER